MDSKLDCIPCTQVLAIFPSTFCTSMSTQRLLFLNLKKVILKNLAKYLKKDHIQEAKRERL